MPRGDLSLPPIGSLVEVYMFGAPYIALVVSHDHPAQHDGQIDVVQLLSPNRGHHYVHIGRTRVVSDAAA